MVTKDTYYLRLKLIDKFRKGQNDARMEWTENIFN